MLLRRLLNQALHELTRDKLSLSDIALLIVYVQKMDPNYLRQQTANGFLLSRLTKFS